MELIALLSAFIIGITALVVGYTAILFLSIYLLIFSLVCDAMVLFNTRHTIEAGKQAVRAAVLFLLVTFLLFHL